MGNLLIGSVFENTFKSVYFVHYCLSKVITYILYTINLSSFPSPLTASFAASLFEQYLIFNKITLIMYIILLLEYD